MVAPHRKRVCRRPADSLELQLLNGFELRAAGRAVPLPEPSQRLIAVLAIYAKPLSRPYVAGLLWPGATRERSMACLRSALRLFCPELVVKSRTHMRLGEHVVVDYHDSLIAARTALAGNLPPEEVVGALGLLAGDLLPDMPDEWVEPFRLRRHQLRLTALETLSDRLLRDGKPSLAAQAAMGAVVAEPLRETAHLRLIRALLAEGNRAQAIRHYQGFCELLQAELGIAPSFRFEDAHDRLWPTAITM
jgi:DNA-binding SARP family transcriptional activator